MLNIKYHNLIKLKLLNKMYTQAEYSKPQRGPQSWHILSFPVHEHYVCGLAKIPVIGPLRKWNRWRVTCQFITCAGPLPSIVIVLTRGGMHAIHASCDRWFGGGLQTLGIVYDYLIFKHEQRRKPGFETYG